MGFGAIKVGRLFNQVLVELVDNLFNLVARRLHKRRVIEDLRPRSPGVFSIKVLLEEEPELEGADTPLRVN